MTPVPLARVALRLAAMMVVVCGLGVSALAQDLPSTTADGMVLTDAQTTTLLNRVKDRLTQMQQPAGWVDDLLSDLPGVRFTDDLGDTQAMYQPVSQGPAGRAGNTLYLRAGLDPNALTSEQLGVIAHEFWHAWFDFVPTYIPLIGSRVGRMSNAQDEAMGGFIEQLAAGRTLGDAVAEAIAEVLNWKGTVQDAVDAIDLVEEYFEGSFFSRGLPTAADVDRWARIRYRYPEVAALEQRLSAADRARVDARVAERAAIDANPDDLLSTQPDEPAADAAAPAAGGTPTATAVPAAPGPSTTAPPGRDTAEAAAALPDCAPCVPIAQKLRDAMRRQAALDAESAQIARRLAQLADELSREQQARDDLRAEYERRLRQTRVRSGSLEAGYFEVGSTVYIGLGATRDGAFVPDVVPNPAVPPSFTDDGPRPSPSMTRLKAKLDAADASLEALRAEQAGLIARQQALDALRTTNRADVEALQRELDACLKACGLTDPIQLDYGAAIVPALPQAIAADSTASLLRGNPTDLLSSLTLYTLHGEGATPFAVAPPGDVVDDQYQLFIVSFIRTGRVVSGSHAVVTLASAAPGQVALMSPRQPAPAMEIVATGASSGTALTVNVLDTGGEPVEIVAPDGLVLQAVRQETTRVAEPARNPLASTPVTGFCLEFHKPPPPPGTVYQVASPAVQRRYRDIRPVLEAGRALAEAQLFRPDSAPEAYATFIQQWAVWTRLEGWDEAAFTRAFVDHTRRNVERAGTTFTETMRETLARVAPNRFSDILAVLVEADGLTGRLPFQLTP